MNDATSRTLFHFGWTLLCRAKRYGFRVLPVLLLLNTGAAAADATSGELPMAAQEALLAADWTAVEVALRDVTPDSAVPMFVYGHALLLQNRNNDSLCNFLLGDAGAGREQWKQWTGEWLAAHPDHPVAHYLHGDALARLARWDEAIVHFDAALSIDAAMVAAANARAVALAGRSELDAAAVALERLIGSQPEFADAYANRGMLYLLRQTAPSGAVRWFTIAIERTPDFALAWNGRGVAHLGAGDDAAAGADFTGAVEKTPCLLLGEENLLLVEELRLRRMSSKLETTLASLPPGTEMHSRMLKRQNAVQSDLQAVARRLPADRHLDGLRRANNRAMAHHFLADLHSGANVFSMHPLAKAGNWFLGQRNRQLAEKQQGVAARGYAAIEQDHRDAVASNIRLFPNGLAAQAHRAMRAPGGVSADTSSMHVDSGNWQGVSWFGLRYPVGSSADESSRGSEDGGQ